MADIVERYPAGSSTANYTGNDLTDVQTHSGAASGDVIKVSQDITVSTTIGNGATSGYSVGSFTLQGASSENPVTISGGTRLYNLPNTVTSFTLKDVTISGFVNSNSTGGAIRVNGPITINLENVTFQNNKENQHHAGAISRDNSSDLVKIVGDNLTFDGNQAAYDAGAVRAYFSISGKNENSVITFKNNTSNSGAVCSLGTESVFSTGTFKFFNNTGRRSSGAIYVVNSLTFSGDDTVAIFEGNKGVNGNDIFLQSQGSTTKLTFKDAGKYSFDGGIHLNNANQNIIIDKAQVTIAGRENDTTNNYVLRSVTISNGGKLTAKLDYIDKIGNTTITLNGTESQVELYNALLNQVASIKSNTGVGTFDLEYSAANGAVQNESLLISSGHIDVKGYMEAAIKVGSDATFSPGNSVGRVVTTEDFTLDGTLLIEVDKTGADTLTCDTFTMNGGTVVLDWQNDEIPFFATCNIITSTSDLSDVYDNLLENLDFSTSPTVQQLYDDGYISLALAGANNNIITMSIDRNAVPEPSTWALLALGVVVLFLRKRVRN
ncbi:MAG: PEP-CTERM sorting domain-containing protein [Thermoguttaceae bacterium]|nr:PEP-CTERM sorting domain-containing protein [Thermoguttaceae bacterium]